MTGKATWLAIRSENAIIYELNVGGFTRHPSAGVQHPGTFSGLIEKIPYLQELGITHVELLPVMAFDEQDVPPGTADLGLSNYWGYSTHSFFSPHPGYCVTPEQGTHIQEFRDLVKALHKAGIGLILDVVFNHTAEGGAGGPIINFKGIDSEIYYHIDSLDKTVFRDYTGCGNTVRWPWWLIIIILIGLVIFFNILSSQLYAEIFRRVSRGIVVSVVVAVIAYAICDRHRLDRVAGARFEEHRRL